MNCREFRRKHDAYIDDTLSGVDLEAMARHRRVCEPCARHDTVVRRALLLAHNLPTIQPSAAFSEKLQARLAQERVLMHAARAAGRPEVEGQWHPFSVGTYAALAAGILTVASLAATMLAADDHPIRLAPVVATRPAPEPSALSAPAMVASMPAGMAVWPALYVAQQAPWHFASDAVGR